MAIKVKDYYWILDVSSTATPTQIRRAYLKLARKYHPDLNPENRWAEEKFKELQEAYQVLSDPDRRRDYDGQSRPPIDSGQPRRPRAASRPRSRPASPPKQGLTDFIQSIFGIKAAKGSRTTRTRDDNVSGGPLSQLVLSLEDAHKGGLHKIAVLERRRCHICRGQKKVDGRPCPACRASGRLHAPVNVDVNIPPGARNGSVIKVGSRDGNSGRSVGREFYVKLVVEPHPVFRVDGDDIYFDVPITPWEAALGAAIEVRGIQGRLQVRVPAGALGGKRIRLRGEGLNRRDGGRGDAYVRLNIVVPENPGEREKSLYRELASITGFNPRSRQDS